MTDIEADGKVPGLSSMLSFASVAITIDKQVIGTFEKNLDFLEGAKSDPETLQWWQTTAKDAWEKCRANTVPPEYAMKEFDKWVRSFPGKPVFVAYPLSFDWMWIYWYLIKFVGESPFGFSGAVCMKSYAWSILQGEFRAVSKRNMPKRWFENLPHTHIAIDDSLEQALTFINILRESRHLEPLTGYVVENFVADDKKQDENQKKKPPPKAVPNWIHYYLTLSQNISYH
eukprot:TRINITY_DN13767_c0_g1_i1.p1 TRINITY_DN13767_c0_g1~~TRINITY_DN13767_c0_g1_i1.p1  ORF type:complete len:259 (+),score=43.03 TRINITY_DN13767_c0_g1_i1:92-778(+)